MTSSFCRTMILLLMISSCQRSNHNNQNALSLIDTPKSISDTSRWLKETRGIRDILEDSNGNLWFSSPDYIAKFDGQSMQYFSDKDGLNIVGNLHEDGHGTIWVEDGFSIFRHAGNHFEEQPLDHLMVPNDLWFQRGLSPADTTYVSPGIYHADSAGLSFVPYPIEKRINNKYLYFPTTKAYLGHDSTVWIGTMEQVFGLKNNTFIAIGRAAMNRQQDERQMGIRGIFVDSKGMLWIADNGAGLFTYHRGETVNFTKKHHLDKGDVEGNTLHRAFSIAEDDAGNMWFGTVYSGIWMYNPKTDELKNYTKVEGVMSDNIWTIYKTKRGKLLFAGESPAAVYQFNGQTFDKVF